MTVGFGDLFEGVKHPFAVEAGHEVVDHDDLTGRYVLSGTHRLSGGNDVKARCRECPFCLHQHGFAVVNDQDRRFFHGYALLSRCAVPLR